MLIFIHDLHTQMYNANSMQFSHIHIEFKLENF